MIPYDKVPHAGGKTCNYYVKELARQNKYELKLISIARKEEIPKLDYSAYGIDAIYKEYHSKGLMHYIWGGLSKTRKINIFRTNGIIPSPFIEFYIKKMVSDLADSGYRPDLIILQWTHIALLQNYVRCCFKDAPIVCIEEDVAYLSLKRKWQMENNKFIKFFRHRLYINLKNAEIDSMIKSDFVILSNEKDKMLLLKDGIPNEKMWNWSPYYQSLSNIKRCPQNRDILFYGAMDRYENWASAIWFIDNVMVHLGDDIRFIVIGNRPNSQLLKRANKRIIVTGFVDDISGFFSDSMCFVAPLILGAGIKIKVLEAMSSGIPVIANNIAMEGIPAENNRDYIHCESAADYIEAVKRVVNDPMVEKIGINGKNKILEKFNFVETGKEFHNIIGRFMS